MLENASRYLALPPNNLDLISGGGILSTECSMHQIIRDVFLISDQKGMHYFCDHMN
jgi:hypothetical protein